LEEVAKLYKERFGGEETENINDVKGRVGSVLDIMKKDSDVAYEGGMYALKARIVTDAPVQKEEKQAKKSPKKTAKKAVAEEVVKEEKAEEKPAKKTVKKAKATKKEPLPPAPIQPIAPVAPVTPEVAPEPIPEDVKEEIAPKKRGRKPKAKMVPIAAIEEKSLEAHSTETVAVQTEDKKEEKLVVTEEKKEVPAPAEKKDEPKELVIKEKAEIAPKSVVMDMSFLFGDKKPRTPVAVKEEKAEKAVIEKKPSVESIEKTEKKAETKPAEKPAVKKTEKVPVSAPNVKKTIKMPVKVAVKKPLSAEEKLKENFLKKLSYLGGEYFEYYSIYLLERYSMKNGRRLEGLRISGGERDGGIDGELELTDRFGFKETIYIQAKGWNPEKGDDKLWVVGETLLQQFIGACACRQAKDKKQHCRGIFITTSRFTPEAKQILDSMSDKIVGYDGNDLFETAKECSFGLIQKNGEWVLDERLLSGTKAFFNLY
jgi:restriction endonuclease Mrr